jgi:hypothetical protein
MIDVAKRHANGDGITATTRNDPTPSNRDKPFHPSTESTEFDSRIPDTDLLTAAARVPSANQLHNGIRNPIRRSLTFPRNVIGRSAHQQGSSLAIHVMEARGNLLKRHANCHR